MRLSPEALPISRLFLARWKTTNSLWHNSVIVTTRRGRVTWTWPLFQTPRSTRLKMTAESVRAAARALDAVTMNCACRPWKCPQTTPLEGCTMMMQLSISTAVRTMGRPMWATAAAAQASSSRLRGGLSRKAARKLLLLLRLARLLLLWEPWSHGDWMCMRCLAETKGASIVPMTTVRMARLVCTHPPRSRHRRTGTVPTLRRLRMPCSVSCAIPTAPLVMPVVTATARMRQAITPRQALPRLRLLWLFWALTEGMPTLVGSCVPLPWNLRRCDRAGACSGVLVVFVIGVCFVFVLVFCTLCSLTQA
eukprot:Opistho-2@81871